jgi:hypothetical protein
VEKAFSVMHESGNDWTFFGSIAEYATSRTPYAKKIFWFCSPENDKKGKGKCMSPWSGETLQFYPAEEEFRFFKLTLPLR